MCIELSGATGRHLLRQLCCSAVDWVCRDAGHTVAGQMRVSMWHPTLSVWLLIEVCAARLIPRESMPDNGTRTTTTNQDNG